MKHKLTSILILFLFIFSVFSVCFLTDNVNATSVTYNTDFEDGVLTYGYNNSWINSYKASGVASISNTYSHSPSKSYKVGGIANLYLNLTYTPNYYLTEFSFWSLKQFYSGTPFLIEFYNTTLSTTTPLIKIDSYSNYYRYYDYTDTVHTLGGYDSDYTWAKIGFNVIDNQTVDYYNESATAGRTTIRDTPRTITANNDYWHINLLKVTGGLVTEYLYFDDFSLVFSDSFSGIPFGLTCGYDMSSYDTIGVIEDIYATPSNSQHIFENYKLPITTTIEGVELSIDSAQYIIDSDLSHYILTINGVNFNNPVCLYEISYGVHAMFWKTDIDIVNTTVSFDFYHSTKLDANNYWYATNGGYARDLDFDGDIQSGQGSVVHKNCHWITYLEWPFWICDDIYNMPVLNFDLSYRFYHTGIQTINVYDYPDLLGLSGYSSKNSTGYIYDLNDDKPIICSYSLNDIAYQYTIELWKNGTQLNNTIFPHLCTYPGSTVGFSPSSTGTYVFKLKKVGYVYNITAYVIGTLPIYSIKTYPPITNMGESYSILYKFFHPQQLIGSAVMFDCLSCASNFNANKYNTEIGSDVTGSFIYNSVGSINEYWRLFAERNGLYYAVGSIAEHIIKVPSIVDNTIGCNVYTVAISSGNPELKSVIITGTHIFPGADVSIYVGDAKKGNVGNSQIFTYYYIPQVPGVYQVDLRLVQNGVTTILAIAPEKLSVTISDVIIPPTDALSDYINNLPLPIKIGLGLFLTLIITLLPLIIGILLSKHSITMPNMVYVGFFFLGLGVSSGLGFLPWVLFFIILFGLILYYVIQHESNNR